MRKINKLANKLAMSIVRHTEMTDSVAILALSKVIEGVAVAGYSIKVGPDSKALGYSEETGGKVTGSTNSQTFDKFGIENLVGAYVEAMESLKRSSKVYIFTNSVKMFDDLNSSNPNQYAYRRYDARVYNIDGVSEILQARLYKMLDFHDVEIRMIKAPSKWIQELKAQMVDTVDRHIHAEYDRMKNHPTEMDARHAASNLTLVKAKAELDEAHATIKCMSNSFAEMDSELHEARETVESYRQELENAMDVLQKAANALELREEVQRIQQKLDNAGVKSFTFDELEDECKDTHAASNKLNGMKLIPREYTVDENENELC